MTPDPRILGLHKQGYTVHQIADLLKLPLSEVKPQVAILRAVQRKEFHASQLGRGA